MKVTTALLTALLAGMLVLAGCGGGGSKKLTKSEFISQADAICAAAQKANPSPPSSLPANFDPNAASATDAQLETFGTFLDRVVSAFRGEVAGLHKLRPPKDYHAKFKQALSLLGEAVDALDRAAGAAHAPNRTKLKEQLALSDSKGAEADALAAGYGFKVCGK